MPTITDHRQMDMLAKPGTWVAPKDLPDWRKESMISIDTETKDDGLNSGRGAGWAFPNAGWIAGISMASSRGAIYVPLRHPDTNNFDRDRVIRWLDAHRRVPTVFHNSSYDLGWLKTDLGLERPISCHDTMIAAPLIDENRFEYGLDACCKWMDVPGKDEFKLREAALALGLDAKKDMWRMPASAVGEYAEQDARSTRELWFKMAKILVEQSLLPAYHLEIDLVPLVMDMRRRGIRIDGNKAQEVQRKFLGLRDQALAELKQYTGQPRNISIDEIHSPKYLEHIFDLNKIDYPRTPKLRQGKFEGEWLEAHPHPMPQLISKIRGLHDAGDKFIQGYIDKFNINGRVHAEIHQLRNERGGTRSYRFSYSNPPLQQMPARDEDIGPAVRSCFLPEEGDEWWSFDFKAQEPRMTVHYAAEYDCVGSKEAVRYYHEDPNPDYHQFVATLTGLPRKQAKIINLGVAYGMGIDKLCASLKVSMEEGLRILEQYHAKMPFIKQLTKILSYQASSKGYIELLDGARCRFDLWEPDRYGLGYVWALPLSQARQRWPQTPLRRAGTHKALNRKIQGGSARQTKLVMRALYAEKFVPLVQMHDELGFSGRGEKDQKRITELMCDTVKLRVPTGVDLAVGQSWGEAM